MDRHLPPERLYRGHPPARGASLSATPQPPDSQFGQLDSIFEAERPADNQSVWPLLAVLSGIFLVQVDLFATLVAMPSIQRDLGFDGGSLQFLIAGFSVANASLLISSGRLGDLYGSRKLYLVGLTLFALSSLCATVANELVSLAVARTLQGVAAALIQPQVLGILARNYQGDASKRAFAAYTFTMGLGSVAGQVLGGLAISLDLFSLGWRSVFLAMVPAALVCALIGWLAIPATPRGKPVRLDWAGVAFSIVLLSLITAPLTIGSSHWPGSINVALLLVAPAVAYAFIRHQRRLYELARPQMLPMRLLLARGAQLDLLAVFCFFGGVASFHVLQTLHLQQAQGATALETGLVFSSMAVGFMIASACAPALAKRLGRSSILPGAAVLIASHVLNMTCSTFDLSLGVLSLAIFAAGLGLGLIMGPLISRVMEQVPPVEAGAMSGLVATLQAAANAVGVAIIPLPFIAASAATSEVARNLGYVGSMSILIGLACVVSVLTMSARRKR